MRALASNADSGSQNVLVTPFSDTVYNLKLTATVEGHCTIPTGATRVLITGSAIFYIKVGTSSVTATVPSGNITDGTGSVIQKYGIALLPTDTTISCISPSACIISLEFFS